VPIHFKNQTCVTKFEQAFRLGSRSFFQYYASFGIAEVPRFINFRVIVQRNRHAQFSGASVNGANGGRPSKKKKPYIRPKVTVVIPGEAEAEVRAKAAPRESGISELIAKARKRQEHGRD
jgi:hypothetical protein